MVEYADEEDKPAIALRTVTESFEVKLPLPSRSERIFGSVDL